MEEALSHKWPCNTHTPSQGTINMFSPHFYVSWGAFLEAPPENHESKSSKIYILRIYLISMLKKSVCSRWRKLYCEEDQDIGQPEAKYHRQPKHQADSLGWQAVLRGGDELRCQAEEAEGLQGKKSKVYISNNSTSGEISFAVQFVRGI